MDNLIFRRLLWLKHGCHMQYLYGDDGEMQCQKCMIDFKRDMPEEIETRLREIESSLISKAVKQMAEK